MDGYNAMECYILQIYDKEGPTASSNVEELSWYTFSKHQYKSDKLLPIKMALEQKVLRSHYARKRGSQPMYPHLPCQIHMNMVGNRIRTSNYTSL